MSSPTTVEEFLELGQKSGLLNKDGLDSYLEQKRSSDSLPAAPRTLAQLMVRDGLLTEFQARLLLAGKWRGFLIDGKYRLLECLGAGGTGSVYLCEHVIMRRRVAVKVLPGARVNDRSSLERFHREARAAAALDHPNIVRAHDVGRDDKLHFLVMEYVEGRSLDRVVAEEGPLDVGRAVRCVAGAACGLQHAHEAGLVHRDIKPANLLVDRAGTVKVLDLGLAFFHEDDDGLTREHDSNTVLGTADFLAPEQAVDSHSVDIRADVYSLGVTFYYLLTGVSPFGKGTVTQKLLWHMMREPRPVRELRPDVPEELAAVLARMMAKDRDARYQTPAEVVAALAPWVEAPAASGDTAVSADLPPRPTPPPDATPLPGRVRASRGVTTSRPRPVLARRPGVPADLRKRPRWLWPAVAAAAVGAVLLVTGAVALSVATDRGTLAVESMGPGVQVTVQGEGQQLHLGEAQAGREFTLKSGRYRVVPDWGGERVKRTPEEFTLARGQRVTLRAWIERPRPELAGAPVRLMVGHTNRIEGVAFSPDGTRALSAGHDQTVRLWEVPAGRLVRTLTGHKGPVWTVAFLPDGRRALSSGSDRTLRLWDVDTGEELRQFRGHTGAIKALAVSPDGRRALSGCEDRTLRLWDVDTGKQLRVLKGHAKGVWWVAISPDGHRALSAGSDKTMRLWDLDWGKELHAFQGHAGEVRRVAFSPDGRRALSGGFDMTLRLWDVESGKELLRCDGRPCYVESVGFSPDGRYALSSEGMVPSKDPAVLGDRGIRLWDLNTGRLVYRRGGVRDKVLHTVFSPDGRFALSACDDKIVRLWELPTLPIPGR